MSILKMWYEGDDLVSWTAYVKYVALDWRLSDWPMFCCLSKFHTRTQIFRKLLTTDITTVLPEPFYGPFSGTTRVSWCQKRNFWTLWCKGRLIEANTPTIRLGATPSRLTSVQCPPSPSSPCFLQAGCPSCRPTNSVKALKATSAFGLGRRR